MCATFDEHPLDSALVSLNILVALGLIAYYLDYPVIYAIAVLFALSEPLYYLLDNHTDVTYVGLIAYGIPAVIILVIGTAALRTFLKRYPMSAEEEADAS